MHKNPFISVLLYVAIFLPFIGIGIIFLDDLEYIFLSEPFEMLIMLGAIGISLIISSLLFMNVNKTKKDGEHVATAPYAGAQKGLSKRTAWICNGALFCLGVFTIGAAIYSYLYPPQ